MIGKEESEVFERVGRDVRRVRRKCEGRERAVSACSVASTPIAACCRGLLTLVTSAAGISDHHSIADSTVLNEERVNRRRSRCRAVCMHRPPCLASLHLLSKNGSHFHRSL